MDKKTQAKHDRRIIAANAVKHNPPLRKKIMLNAAQIYIKGI